MSGTGSTRSLLPLPVRCVYCGGRSSGPVCHAHDDLPKLEGEEQ